MNKKKRIKLFIDQGLDRTVYRFAKNCYRYPNEVETYLTENWLQIIDYDS